MAVVKKDFEVNIRHIGKANLITNYGILCLLEDIACIHSDMAGYGITQTPQTHLSWVLLNWKVSVFNRVPFGAKVTVKTWSRHCSTVSTLRDFEVYDEHQNLICIASSKWVLVNSDTKHITKITDEINSCYEPEEKSVFNENDIAKLKEPENISLKFSFNVLRRDIDFNEHMHNLYYLSYAYEALPEDVYTDVNIDNFEIMYKTSAKLGSKVDCYYGFENDSHYVVMKTDSKLCAIIKFN